MFPDAVPVRAAVTVPAEKFPDPSLATMADAVLAEAAVVAEFETLPAVEIVASFVSTMPAAALMSAFSMFVIEFPVPSASSVLFVRVSAVALPTSVSGPAGSVRVPPEPTSVGVLIVGEVSVLFVRVSVPARDTTCFHADPVYQSSVLVDVFSINEPSGGELIASLWVVVILGRSRLFVVETRSRTAFESGDPVEPIRPDVDACKISPLMSVLAPA